MTKQVANTQEESQTPHHDTWRTTLLGAQHSQTRGEFTAAEPLLETLGQVAATYTR
jgi:hypothetical protein